MAAIIHTSGTHTYIEPKNGTNFTLAELQKIVGGYIEVIDMTDAHGTILVINEEGKLNGLPYNPLATEVYREYYRSHHKLVTQDYIVGDALLCHTSQVR